MQINMSKGSITINSVNHTVQGNITIDNDTITIDGNTVGACSQTVNITVHGDVQTIKNSCGTVTATTVGVIHTKSGNVKCKTVRGSVNTMIGDVECTGIAGNVQTMSGDVTYR